MRITTIDKLVEEEILPENCSIVKIDVDGYDLKVLQGATKLMSLCGPVIYGEFLSHCLAWHGQTHSDVVEYASLHSYKTYVRNEKKLVI